MHRVNPLWLKLGFLAVGLSFIVLYEAIADRSQGSHLLDHVIFLLVLACLEQVVELNLVRDSGFDEHRQIERLVQSGYLAEGVGRIANEVKNRVKLDAGAYVIRHPNLAIWSYYHFWKWLVREQSVHGKKRPLTLAVIHSNSMEPWRSHEYTKRLYAQHYLFCQRHGRVTRILCAAGTEPSPDVLDVAKHFTAVGVTVKYYDTSKEIVDFTFGFDFLWVKETNDIVVWQSPLPGPGGGIERAIYQRGANFEGTQIADLWSALEGNSKFLRFSPDELAPFVPIVEDEEADPAA